MDDDNGLRDAVRSLVLHLWGEHMVEVGKKAKLEEGGAIHFDDRIIHSKDEFIEAMVDHHFKEGRLADALKKFHQEHGFYPPLPDLAKLPRMGRM